MTFAYDSNIYIDIYLNNSVDINKNRQETWGRADYK